MSRNICHSPGEFGVTRGLGSFVLLPLAGCTTGGEPSGPGEVSYEELARACGRPFEDAGVSLAGNTVLYGLPTGCGTALWAALGVDANTVGEAPDGFVTASTISETVAAGLVTLLGTSHLTLNAAAISLPPSLRSEMSEAAGAEDEDLGRVWFEYMRSSVSGISYEPDMSPLGYYDAGSDVVVLGDIMGVVEDGDATIGIDDLASDPVVLAALLAHESSHAVVPRHVPCPVTVEEDAESCDPDGSGAYGASLAWLVAWTAANADSIDAENCSRAQRFAELSCQHVVDPTEVEACNGGYPPCN